jgi:DNA-binding CsgD family transcriptional regulator
MEFSSSLAASLPANLLSNVYATVGREDLWPTAMEALCCEFRATRVVIRQYDFLARMCQDLHRCPHHSSLDARLPSQPALGAAGWREADRSFHDGVVISSTALAAGSGRNSSDQSADERVFGFSTLHGVLNRSRWHAQVVCIERFSPSQAFDSKAAHLLEQLLAHLHRARSLGDSVGAKLHERTAFIAVLQQVPFACLLVNQHCYIRFINKAAAAMLSRSELRVIADRLCGSDSKNSALLWQAVSRAAANGGVSGEVSLALPLESMDAPLVLKLFPVHENGDEVSRLAGTMVAIVAKDPMGAAFESLGRLSEIYGLTPAESRLVGHLSKRAGLFEAAEKIGISKNTARTHMRHIYAKLNVHCQADLMRLLSRFGML